MTMSADRLQRYANSNRPIDKVVFRALINQDLYNQPNSLERFYSDISKTFGWKAANSSSKERLEEYVALYTELKNGAAVKLLSFLVDPKSANIGFVVGKRGAGKTALCNFVTTTKFGELQSSDLTWLRCDIAKLHVLNEEIIEVRRKTPQERWSINDYTALHGFSVMIEYAKNDRVFGRTLQFEASWGQNPEVSPVEARLQDLDPALAAAWKHVRNTDFDRRTQIEQRRLDKSNDQDLKWYFDQLYEHVRGALAERLFRAVMSMIDSDYREETGRAPRLVLIFDGVDNLRNDELAPASMRLAGRSARSWYLDYLSELRQYLTSAGTALPAEKYVLVVRHDTEVDLGPKYRASQHRTEEDDSRIEVDCPDVQLALNRKRQYLGGREDLCPHIDGELQRAERLDTFDWFLHEFIKVYASSVASVLKPQRQSISANDVLRIVFNNNLRSFSRNLIRSFAYFDSFCKNSKEFVVCQNIEERFAFYRKHIYVILEASIVAGNKYMRVNFDKNSRGRWCPNFFEFAKSGDARWNGLVIFRVLQVVPSVHSEHPRPTLRQIISRLSAIGYHSDVVRVAVYTCLEFGLICLFESTFEEDGNEQAFSLEKTEKGEYLQEFVFSRINYLYLIATGGAFAGLRPEEVMNVTVSKYLHRTGVTPRFFHSSALRLVAMTLQHIVAAHKRDISLLPADHPDHSVFVAPNFTNIFHDAVFFEREVPANDQREFQQVWRDLEGRVSDEY